MQQKKRGFWDLFKKAAPQAPIHDIRTVDVDALRDYPDGIVDINARRFDGFLIRNVFSSDEVVKLLAGLKKLPQGKWYQLGGGFSTYPDSFARISGMMAQAPAMVPKAVAEWETFVKDFEANFGVDYFGRLNAVLESISSGKKVVAPTGLKNFPLLSPACFRTLEPGKGKGKLNAHCGNLFQEEFPEVFSELGAVTQIDDQLSYFFLLQNSENGGELTLFDLEWEEVKIRVEEDVVLQNTEGELLPLKKCPTMDLRPQPGDMIIFAGGQIWHRVAQIQGKTPRITLGGILTNSPDERVIHTWT